MDSGGSDGGVLTPGAAMNARTGAADEKYVLKQDGRRVVLPRTGREENHRSFAYEPADEAALAWFKQASLRGRARSRSRDPEIEAALVLEHTESDSLIVVAAPERFGGDVRRRRVGELSGSWGFSLGVAISDLAGAFDEIVCTGVLHRGEYLYLDIPRPSVLVPAIRAFLSQHAVPGAESGGQGRRSPAEVIPAARRHTQRSEPTDAALGHIRTFPERRLIGAVTFRTRQGWASPRCIELVDAASGRVLGEVAMGRLFVEDERDRSDLLDIVDAARIPAARPLDEPFARDDDAWPGSRVPNMWTYWFVQGLELRSRNPADPRSSTSLAYYNPTYKRLWVEDSRLVVPACVYAARLGVEIADVGVPRRPWTLDDEIPFYELKDASLKLRKRHDVAVQPQLLESVRHLVPDDLFPAEDVTWHPSPQPVPYHPESHQLFLQHERHIAERGMLFGVHKLYAKVQPCGLCGRPSRAFTATISTDRLGYCQECVRHAALGALRTVRRKRDNRIRAARALTLLGQHEFGGVPMLESQLDTLHIDPGNPVPARDIDRLLLLRFAVARGRYPWTHLLEEAGFGEDGLRTGRGTLIRARDGHRCLSLMEKTVCDFLHQHGVAHDREPSYPLDAELNPHGLRRADWKLADGTFVELWGLPQQAVYAARMQQKQQLAAHHGIALVELWEVGIARLSEAFARWLPVAPAGSTPWKWSPAHQQRSTAHRETAAPSGSGRGNAFNAAQRSERLERCRRAVGMRAAGLSRAAIGEQFGVTVESVAALLRDGKFYADPDADRARLRVAHAAALAKHGGETRAQFRSSHGLSEQKAHEAWRDVEVIGAVGT